MNENELAAVVFQAGMKVHRALGPGLLESVYETCLFYELDQSGLQVEKQKNLPVIYRDIEFDTGYRIDLLVENKLIVEIKSVQELSDLHMAQVITYLKLSQCKLGLLMNFNAPLFKTGVKRIANGMRH